MLLKIKFGVAFGICNQLSLGWVNLRTKNLKNTYLINTYIKKMCIKNKNEKGTKH